jgi:hypothetical protein
MDMILFVGVSPQYALDFSLSSGGLITQLRWYFVRPTVTMFDLRIMFVILNEVKNPIH